MSSSPQLALDVAHPPRHPDVVEDELLEAWDRIRNSSTLRVLKIIHGHGSSGRGGSTKGVVRNWVFRNRDRFKGVIEGEMYNITDEHTAMMRRAVGQFADPDLGAGNPGITIVWIK